MCETEQSNRVSGDSHGQEPHQDVEEVRSRVSREEGEKEGGEVGKNGFDMEIELISQSRIYLMSAEMHYPTKRHGITEKLSTWLKNR